MMLWRFCFLVTGLIIALELMHLLAVQKLKAAQSESPAAVEVRTH
jgi:hypothetical protein